MIVLLTSLSALCLLAGGSSASSADWVTIQNGQFYVGEDPFLPIGRDGHSDFLEYIEEGVNVFNLGLWWLDIPETDETIIGTFNDRLQICGKDAEFDGILRVAEEHGMFLLLKISEATAYHFPYGDRKTPFDKEETVFNVSCGGPCNTSEEILTHPEAIRMMKARIRKIVDRWGNSSAIFGWDLMNEMNVMPNPEEQKAAWVKEMGEYIKEYELERYGRHHLRTVSSVGPNPKADFFYSSPGIDFVSSHMYIKSVLEPKDTIGCALGAGASVGSIVQRCPDDRPYLDTEYGPLEAYKKQLWSSEYTEIIEKAYDNMAWAELAAGAAGPGFGWTAYGGERYSQVMHSFASFPQGEWSYTGMSPPWYIPSPQTLSCIPSPES